MAGRRFFIVFLLVGLASCAINPVTGKKELSLISESQELALGKQTDIEVRQQYGVYGDAGLNAYVQAVGRSLGPYTHRPHLAYQFAVLDTPVVNAFAVPGGYIYVTRGILALMGSEAELAVVLGHELGHVNARHSVHRMSEMMLVQVGLAAGSVLSETFAEISGLAGVGVQLLFLKYSRDDERQADALGVEYARKGAYNPGEMVAFFSSLEKLGDLSGGHVLPGFLSTHPLTSERIDRVRQMLTEGDGKLEVKERPYLGRIDGLVYGDDPRQGYVEGQVYYHPELAFSFAVPDGWKVVNTPAQVAVSSPNEKAVLLLQAEKTAAELPSYAENKAATIKGSQFVRDDQIKVPGLASYHPLYRINQQDADALSLRLSVIRKGAYIYTFSALAAESDFADFEAAFRRSTQSFAKLTDPAFLQRKPSRIRIIEASGRQTLEQIFSAAAVKKDLWSTLTILNGMEIGARPAHGKIVKIVN
jgi:predicted Zn-dependent protease